MIIYNEIPTKRVIIKPPIVVGAGPKKHRAFSKPGKKIKQRLNKNNKRFLKYLGYKTK